MRKYIIVYYLFVFAFYVCFYKNAISSDIITWLTYRKKSKT